MEFEGNYIMFTLSLMEKTSLFVVSFGKETRHLRIMYLSAYLMRMKHTNEIRKKEMGFHENEM